MFAKIHIFLTLVNNTIRKSQQKLSQSVFTLRKNAAKTSPGLHPKQADQKF